MLPLASATGYATIVGSVAIASTLVWWLLRTEASETAAREAREREAADGTANGEAGRVSGP